MLLFVKANVLVSKLFFKDRFLSKVFLDVYKSQRWALNEKSKNYLIEF